MKLQVSTRHVKLRIVLFVVFFLIAVGAFTLGFVNMGKKTAGYQRIEANTDASALLYNNAVTFRYFFDGTSNEIKHEVKALQEVYTRIYAQLYKALDCNASYEGVMSMGELNARRGETVQVSPQLYAILKDAYAKTLENKGYNMFAGALYEAWRSILILQEPQEFDPLYNETEAQRIGAIANVVSDLGNFSLEFLSDSDCLVRFDVSDSYSAFEREYELDSPVMDLNVLKDAYLLEYLASELVSEGYSLGYLCTPEGSVVCMSSLGTLDYDMYTLEKGQSTRYASIPLSGRFCAVSDTAFGMGSPYAYSIESAGCTYYRNLHFDPRNGDFANVLMSLSLIAPDNSLVELSYLALQIDNLKAEREVESFSSALDSSIIASYVFQSAEK